MSKIEGLPTSLFNSMKLKKHTFIGISKFNEECNKYAKNMNQGLHLVQVIQTPLGYNLRNGTKLALPKCH